jgi:hypothetical protein
VLDEDVDAAGAGAAAGGAGTLSGNNPAERDGPPAARLVGPVVLGGAALESAALAEDPSSEVSAAATPAGGPARHTPNANAAAPTRAAFLPVLIPVPLLQFSDPVFPLLPCDVSQQTSNLQPLTDRIGRVVHAGMSKCSWTCS